MILIDSNVPMYLVGADHPHKVDAQRLLERCISKRRRLVTDAKVMQDRHDVPVVYLTAHSDQSTLSRAKLTGPFGYILKPFDERDLAIQIELALFKHKTERQLREQRELLRVTLSSIGDAVIATDAKGSITFINPVATSLTVVRPAARSAATGAKISRP